MNDNKKAAGQRTQAESCAKHDAVEHFSPLPVRYSRGGDIHDNQPELREAADFRQFCKAILGAAKLPLRDAVPFEAKCFGEVCGTEDMRIGVDNFVKNGPKAKAAFVHR